MNVYCSIGNWIREHNPDFDKLQASLCLEGLFGKTFVNPSKEQVAEYTKLAKSKNKADRRILVSKIRSHYLNVDIHEKSFAPGKYATINNNNTVEISAPSAGTFTVKSGKDLKSVYKIKLNPTFEAEWKFRIDEDKNMCVADFVSGEMSHEGITLTGIVQPQARLEGGSEYVKSSINMKMLNWYEVTGATCQEIKNKVPIIQAAVTCAGLLQYILLENEKVPEYTEIGKLVHTAMCYEPFAMWYILVQPFSENQALPGRVIEEWNFSPCVHPEFSRLWDEFAQKYPNEINHEECKALVADAANAGGKFSIDELRDSYADNCQKLFGHIAHFPCEQKLWMDEVCFYICHKMCAVRKNNDESAFKELCDTLKNHYPGIDHKNECKIASEEYWARIASKSDVSRAHEFINSFCCMKHCHCGPDALSKQCEDTLKSLDGAKPSRRLINTILLNKPFCGCN
jgi:hypothetical protein